VSNPSVLYCGGNTPCYGPSTLATHATSGNCWGWNLDRVVNVTSYAPKHPPRAGSGSLESTVSTCNHDIHAILIGVSAISGYTTSGGSTKHKHNSSTNNNTGGTLASYLVGYYDPAKP
jgi:hypothetical protein